MTPASDEELRRRLRIHGSIARSLGIQIISGALPPGHLFDAEVQASSGLQVSRAAYREALRVLKAKGLVEARPKAGTRVTDPQRWNLLDPDVLQWIFDSDPDPALITHLFELRGIVEPRAAALAAARRSSDDLAEMEAALELMARHTLASPEGQAADQRFHHALLRASGNPFLASLASGVGAAVSWTTIYKTRLSRLRRDPVPDHWAVYAAVAAGDPISARATMEMLVERALADTLP